jgi:hypothetical protein
MRFFTLYRRVALTASVIFAAAAGISADEPIDYVRQVKPLLERHCYSCHGPEKQESGLRVDSRAGLIEGGNSGPAIVPGKPQESLLLQAIRGQNDLTQMPDEAPPLAEADIQVFSRWIEGGAVAPADEPLPEVRKKSKHWSFQPVVRPPLPRVRQADWPRNFIDRFVLARLESQGVAPSPEAGRATLIRRLSLDLLGVLPSPSEVEAFVANRDPAAYERLVERLLASPHYGERWARHWLDLARYGDSNGYTIDGSRSIWKYRDWVIEALNRDLSFDQFTIEQLAGDMLPNPTTAQLIATGFHRNTLKNEEGGTDAEQFRVEAVVDRVETTGAVFLGLTVGCARCHDHKYDPLSQREFYQLFALFNNADEPTLSVPTDRTSRELPALDSELAQLNKRLMDSDASAPARRAEWERRMLALGLEQQWTPLAPRNVKASAGPKPRLESDGAATIDLGDPAARKLSFNLPAPSGPTTALRLELTWTPPAGDSSSTLLIEPELSLASVPASEGGERKKRVPLVGSGAWQEGLVTAGPLDRAADGDKKTVAQLVLWRRDGQPSAGLVLPLRDDFSPQPNASLAITVNLSQPNGRGTLRLRWFASGGHREVLALPERARAALALSPAERSAEQAQALDEDFTYRDLERLVLVQMHSELSERKQQLAKATTTTLVMRERPSPRETFVHLRGDFLRPGAKVEPSVPAVLPPLSAARGRANRLDFARWLVDRKNPLTARVTVNRLWQAYFGKGLVETENDLGTQGSPPTHPELLDALAAELVDLGWSLKAMHRLIVNSATYRQASHTRADLAQRDPDNRLLARQARLRLEAEVVRDAALAAAGLLCREIGGPGVYPPQPEGIYRFTQSVKYWRESQGEERYRRGLYIYFWRSSPYPFLATFDAPNGNVSCTRRIRSNTPLQALSLANDRVFVEASQALAMRILQEATGDEARVRRAFQLCLARLPEAEEQQRLLTFLDSQRSDFRGSPQDAAEFLPGALPEGVDRSEAAAWAALARVLVNLDEFITRE